MKTALLFVLILHCARSGYAQLEKGTLRLGETIGLNDAERVDKNSSNPPAKTLYFNFNPNVSYFLLNRFSLGLIFPLIYSKLSLSSINSISTSWSAGPALRYYFPFERWAVFPELAYSLGRQNFQGSAFSFGNLSSFRGAMGITYFFNSSIAVEGLLFYPVSQVRFNNSETENISSLNLNIGRQIYFSRKKQ